jgi:hypothetical protein
MKRIHALGLWLVLTSVMCVTGAATATSASAIVPGLGSCHHVGAHGEQEESRCFTAEKDGPYQWCWFSVKYAFTSLCSEVAYEVGGWRWVATKVVFSPAKEEEVAVNCKEFSAEGSYTLFGVHTEEAVFTGCKSFGFPCQSSGAKGGEIVTEPLEGTLGIVDAKAGEVGLRLWTPSGTLMKFTCAEIGFEVTGSAIAGTIADESTSALPITYEANEVQQIPNHFEGEAKAGLELSVEGEPFEEIGLNASIAQESETPVEILCSRSFEEALSPEACRKE